MTITIPTGDLTGVLSDVIPFASDDDEYPELACVRVEWDGETLHALTTDRFHVAIGKRFVGAIVRADRESKPKE